MIFNPKGQATKGGELKFETGNLKLEMGKLKFEKEAERTGGVGILNLNSNFRFPISRFIPSSAARPTT